MRNYRALELIWRAYQFDFYNFGLRFVKTTVKAYYSQRQVEAQTPNKKKLEHVPDVKLLCNLKLLFAKNCQILIDFNKGKM